MPREKKNKTKLLYIRINEDTYNKLKEKQKVLDHDSLSNTARVILTKYFNDLEEVENAK